jgi:hypothetical protein
MVRLQKAYDSDVREIQNEVAKVRADSETLQQLRLRAIDQQ